MAQRNTPRNTLSSISVYLMAVCSVDSCWPWTVYTHTHTSQEPICLYPRPKSVTILSLVQITNKIHSWHLDTTNFSLSLFGINNSVQWLLVGFYFSFYSPFSLYNQTQYSPQCRYRISKQHNSKRSPFPPSHSFLHPFRPSCSISEQSREAVTLD